MTTPEAWATRLQTVFEDIARTRMQGLPMVNPALQVQAVGFRDWQGRSLGVLLTPWSMNLMLLPAVGEDWGALQPGSKTCHQLPSGPYEFVLGEEPGIGPYQQCSLFSPMFDFPDQDTALATATAVMEALYDAENRDPLRSHEQEIARIWRGESAEPQADTHPEQSAQQPLKQRLEKPMSRRAWLRGDFLREGEP